MFQSEGSPNRYRGMFHAFRTIIHEEGARALYKGWLPSVIGVVCYHDPFLILRPCFGSDMDVMFALSDCVVSAFVLDNPVVG